MAKTLSGKNILGSLRINHDVSNNKAWYWDHASVKFFIIDPGLVGNFYHVLHWEAGMPEDTEWLVHKDDCRLCDKTFEYEGAE